jgi:hypothetical protein
MSKYKHSNMCETYDDGKCENMTPKYRCGIRLMTRLYNPSKNPIPYVTVDDVMAFVPIICVKKIDEVVPYV